MKIIIGLDFDGVIADTVFLKQKYAKKLFGIELNREDCNKKFALEKGISKEMYELLQKTIYPSKTLECPEIPDAIDYIKKLEKDHEIKIISSRKENSHELIDKWLYIKEIPLEVILTNNSPKTEYVKGVTFFLDDDLRKLEEIAEVIKFPCLLDSACNRREEIKDSRIKKVSWKEFYDLVPK